MISTRLTEDMKLAMKARDKSRLSVIRMLSAELKNALIAARHELSEEEEEKVVSSYAKKRKEMMDTYKGMGRSDPQIVAALGVGVQTVGRVRQRFVEEGFQAALAPRPRPRILSSHR